MRLSLLLPARRHAEGSAALERWIARGDRLADAVSGRDTALRECFEFTGAAVPVAALTRSLDGDEAAAAKWLRADPAFVMADAVTLRLLRCGNMDLSAAEVEGFAQALKPLFGDAGLPFDAPHPQRWYLRCAQGVALPQFSSPDDALGDDLANHLPEGADARRWRSLLNEVQIVLTQHPLNAQRIRRGLAPVNSLWFWGAGTLPHKVHCEFDDVCSDDEVATALGRLAGASARSLIDASATLAKPSPSRERGRGLGEGGSLPSLGIGDDGKKNTSASNPLPRTKDLFGGKGSNARVLVDLARERDARRLESEWFSPIDAAVKRREIDRLHLLFESGERCIVKPAHRWRFWRRVKPRA
jgi:hypothetical protein